VTDPWSRPAGHRPVVEIELSGGDPVPARPGDAVTADPPRRNGRIVLLLGGAAIAAIVGVAVSAGGGDVETTEAPSTSFDAALITTPPVLDTLPAATLPATRPGAPGRGTEPGVDAPDMTFPTEATFDPTTVTVPAFDELPDSAASELDGYDLLTAAAGNATGGTSMRTTVRLFGIQVDGLFGNEARVVITNDPGAGRDALRIERDVGEEAEIVTDRTTGTVYRTDTGIDGRWEQFDGGEFVDGTGATTVDALFDALVEGPITADSLATATSIAADDGLVRLDGGAIARRWHVVIPIDGLRPYGQLLLAGVSERTVTAGTAPSEIAFDAYVTDQGRLALVAGRFESDGVVYALEQYFDRRPANVIIDLPDADALLPRSPQPGP
jgi:hypothetical protein